MIQFHIAGPVIVNSGILRYFHHFVILAMIPRKYDYMSHVTISVFTEFLLSFYSFSHVCLPCITRNVAVSIKLFGNIEAIRVIADIYDMKFPTRIIIRQAPPNINIVRL